MKSIKENSFLIVSNGKESILEFHKELVSGLLLANCKISIFNPSLTHEDLKNSFNKIELDNINIIKNIPEFKINNIFKIFFVLFCHLLKTKYNYVICFMISSVFLTGLLSIFFHRSKFIATIEGKGSIFHLSKNIVKKYLKTIAIQIYFNIIYAGFYKIVFLNIDDQKYFNSRFFIFRKKKQLLLKNGNGIRLAKHKLKKNNKNDRIIKFIMVSRLIEEKGINEFINASLDIAKKFPNAKFTHIGGEPLPPRYISSSLKNSVCNAKHIKFLGQKNNVNDFIENHDIFVLPSYSEGFSAAIMEALTSGLYVLTTDAAGCRQSIQENYEGKIVAVKNISELKEAMIECCNNIENIRNNSALIRMNAIKRFDSFKNQRKIKNFILS